MALDGDISLTVLNHDLEYKGYHHLEKSLNERIDSIRADAVYQTTKFGECEEFLLKKDGVGDNKYEEAAYYVKKGASDAKFQPLPTNKFYNLYRILNSKIYFPFPFSFCIIILAFALFERPWVWNLIPKVEPWLLLCLELGMLIFLMVDAVLHTIMYWGNFWKHRDFYVLFLILAIFAEILYVMIKRDWNHGRYTRLLRPILLLNTHLMTPVRRVARQIIQTSTNMMKVLILLLIHIFIFSVAGYLIFSSNDQYYFASFSQSFLSLFIASTTANYPDVMLQAFADRNATPIFYVLYLILTLYFGSNILFATIYSYFLDANRAKFKERFLLKCESLSKAFSKLTDGNEGTAKLMNYDKFYKLMKTIYPNMFKYRIFSIFHALHDDPVKIDTSHGITLDEFLRLYEILDFSWDIPVFPWTLPCKNILTEQCKSILKTVHSIFKLLLALMIIAYSVVLSLVTEDQFRGAVSIATFIFCFYIVFTAIRGIIQSKMAIIGTLFDVGLIVSFIAFSGGALAFPVFSIILPFKLYRIFRLKRYYRDLLGILFDLIPFLLTIIVIIFLIFYLFAIIGMDVFYKKVHQGCCEDALYDVGEHYKDKIVHNSSVLNLNVYYLVSFDNVLLSYVTLFNLMVVNNWFIIMEGHAAEAGNIGSQWLTRIYFIMFYFVTSVVLQVLIAYIVEAFVLKNRVLAKRRYCIDHKSHDGCNCILDGSKTVEVKLTVVELKECKNELISYKRNIKNITTYIHACYMLYQLEKLSTIQSAETKTVCLKGSRSSTKENVQYILYREDMVEWRKKIMKDKKINIEETSVGKTLLKNILFSILHYFD